MAKHDIDTGLYLVAMVGIVAVIGLVVLVLNNGGSVSLSDETLYGMAPPGSTLGHDGEYPRGGMISG